MVYSRLQKFLDFSGQVGKMSIFLWQICSRSMRGINIRNLLMQIQETGIKSFPVVFLTSFTTGMVMALQMGVVTRNWFGEPMLVGMTVSFSMVKELAPILTAVIMIGRVGAAMTAEIATMKVTEQIDALQTLGAEPIQYLAAPRFLAFVFTMPLLTFLADIISVIGGMMISILILNIPISVYFADITDYMLLNDVMHGLIKAFFFGVIAAWISIYQGFDCEGGAEGVGKSITSGVVMAIVFMLVSDYFLTSLLINIGIGAGGDSV